MTRAAYAQVMLAGAFALCAAAAWSWQATVRARGGEATDEAWERVKRTYPIDETTPALPRLAPEVVTRVLSTNPFSEQRQPIDEPATSGSAALPVTAPQFLYKGRINMGQRQRAIVEETGSHKTYFLEVGQAVAGFKVLDITENRVVLSNPVSQAEVVVSLNSASKDPAKMGGSTQ